ncbi:MAG: penicillin acylase family protein, partial [Gemmataceae bacterium]|nr:penicillin acylase family protein [Gemmataceae bacterium]
HQDVFSARAQRCVRLLVQHLENDADQRVRQALGLLRDWGFRIEADCVPAAIYDVFLAHWTKAVTAARFPKETAGFVAANAGGIAMRLLDNDEVGWFEGGDRSQTIRAALVGAVDELTSKLGSDMSAWHWGRLHFLQQKHFLSGRGDLGTLLDLSGLPVNGDANTVNSASPDPSFAAWLGAGYRMVADLGTAEASLWQIEVGGASGQPGSPHYDDQLDPWRMGAYHHLALMATKL